MIQKYTRHAKQGTTILTLVVLKTPFDYYINGVYDNNMHNIKTILLTKKTFSFLTCICQIGSML